MLFYPCLVLVQPAKTRPYINESLFIGRKVSNQTIKNINKQSYKGHVVMSPDLLLYIFSHS